jgi:hypothetical protein
MIDDEQPSATDPAEIEALLARLQHSNLAARDAQLLERLLRLLLTLLRVVEHKNFTISRLKRLLCGPGTDQRQRTQAPPTAGDEPPNSAAVETSADPPTAPTTESTSADNPPARRDAQPSLRRGHGRRAALESPGARVVRGVDPQLGPGDACPDEACRGHLYDTRAGRAFYSAGGASSHHCDAL